MTKAAALREEALAKLTEARALVVNDEIPAESQEQFDALMGEFRTLDADHAKAATSEDQIGTLEERLSWYGSKVTGTPVRFSRSTVPGRGMTPGQAFVESREYAALVAGGALHSDRASIKTEPVLVGAAATDVVRSNSQTSGGALVTPEYLPEVLPLPQRALTVRGLFGAGTTASDQVSYAQQSAFDNAAAAVAQATSAADGAKPQSSIAWIRKTSPVETIATWMAATRQQLADAGQVRALIDNALQLMLQLEEEDQLLNGNGTSPNLSGIYDQAIQTLNLTAATSDGDPNLDGIRNAMRLVKTGISRLSADFLAVNPIDSMEFDLLVDGNGQYRVGDPYGATTSDAASPSPIWKLRRVETEAIAQGHALVGAGKAGATVLERQGVAILVADQHADFFIRNLIVVLAEERLGFPIYFPSAFVDVTLHAWGS